MSKGGPKNTGQFGKGNPGKPKGAVNKTTKALKEMILGALDAKGGQTWLETQMDENPTAMLTLLGKVLPQDINAALNHKGAVGGVLMVPAPVSPDQWDQVARETQAALKEGKPVG